MLIASHPKTLIPPLDVLEIARSYDHDGIVHNQAQAKGPGPAQGTS